MRIIDDDGKRALTSIVILLTPEEAFELASKLRSIDASQGEHIHVDDIEYKREITFAVYTGENREYFSKEINVYLDSEI